MGLTAKSAVAVDSSRKVYSFIKFRDSADLFKLTFENENVRQVDCFAEGYGSDKHVNEAKRMEISSRCVLSQLFYSGGHLDFGPLQKTQIVSAPDHATHIARSVAAGSIAVGETGKFS